jgi:hypothetical protein
MDNYTFIQWIKEDYSFLGLDKWDNDLVCIFQFKSNPSFASIKSSFVVEIIDSFEENNYFYIVTPEQKGINLKQFNEISKSISPKTNY